MSGTLWNPFTGGVGGIVLVAILVLAVVSVAISRYWGE